ncbi:hypothetical protein [Mesorhizobium sp. Mes31]|nr:hypothetical protein [Mesorhizobium sp. Mes31]
MLLDPAAIARGRIFVAGHPWFASAVTAFAKAADDFFKTDFLA